MSSHSTFQDVQPNPFGNGIKFRDGEPLWLARYIEKSNLHPDGKVELNQQALNVLSNIWEPVAVIAIVGAFRRGKSWFANVLHGRHDGFALGSYVEGCTKGVWMWSQPFPHNDMRVIVFDCEGLEDPDQDQDWAIKLFLLCLTLSSTFIYNIPGVLGSGDVTKLYLMNDLQRFVQPPKDEKFLPRLVVLLRDFYLKHKTEPSEYFMKTLAKVNRDAAEGIKKNFKDFDIYCLPHPGCSGEILLNMHEVKNSQLDDKFVTAAAQIGKDIFQKLSPKYINDRPMPGAAFCNFLQDVVKTLNSPLASMHLSIPDEYQKTVQFVAQKAMQDGLNYYKAKMQNALNTDMLPVSWDEFNEIHARVLAGALKSFNAKTIGTLTQITKFMEDLQKNITDVAKQYHDDNSRALVKQIETVSNNHWIPMVKDRLQPGKPDTFGSYEELENALEEFELTCSKNVIACPEVVEVLEQYRTVHYREARDQMHFLGLYNEQLANAKRLEFEQKQQAQRHAAEIERINNDMKQKQHETEEKMKATNSAFELIKTQLEQQKAQASKLEKLAKDRQNQVEQLEQKMRHIESQKKTGGGGICTIL